MIEKIDVIEVLDLELPEDIWDYLCDFYDVFNDSYKRYYPHPTWKYIKAEVKAILNQKLTDMGLKIPENDEHFHVLLRFDW